MDEDGRKLGKCTALMDHRISRFADHRGPTGRKANIRPWDKLGDIQPPLRALLQSNQQEWPRKGRALVPGCGRVSDDQVRRYHITYKQSRDMMPFSSLLLWGSILWDSTYPQLQFNLHEGIIPFFLQENKQHF